MHFSMWQLLSEVDQVPGPESGESKIHKADTIRHRQNLKSGREGRAGQPLDVQENWDQGQAQGYWELESRGPRRH